MAHKSSVTRLRTMSTTGHNRLRLPRLLNAVSTVWRHGVRATHPIMLLPGPVSRRTYYASFLLSFHQQEPLPKAPVQDSMDDDSQEHEP